MDGWIKLHRKIFENPVVCKDSDYFTVWVYLLSNAASRRVKVLFGKQKITLEAGQLVCSRSKIASKLNINREKVRRILDFFAKEGQLVQQIEPYGQVITICSWSDYQFCVQPIEEEDVLLRKSTDNQDENGKNEKTVCNDLCNNSCNNLCNSSEKEKNAKEFENKEVRELPNVKLSDDVCNNLCNDSCNNLCNLHATCVQPLSVETPIVPSVENDAECATKQENKNNNIYNIRVRAHARGDPLSDLGYSYEDFPYPDGEPDVFCYFKDIRVPLEVVPSAWAWVKMREETGRPIDRAAFFPMYRDLKKIAPSAEEQIRKFEEWTKNKDIGREVLPF